MTASPIEWESVENALREWVVTSTELADDRVIWDEDDETVPKPPRPFAWLTIVAGPRDLGQHEPRPSTQLMRDLLTVTGPAAVVVRVHGIDPDDAESFAGRTYTSGPTLSATATRDALLAALAAEPDLTLASSGAAAIQVDGTAARGRFHLVVVSGPASNVTQREPLVETVYQPQEITVRVQVEAATRQPSGHARGLMSRVLASLGDRSVLRELRAGGCFYKRTFAPVDLTALIADRHVSRVSQEFHFAINSAFDRQVPWVRTAGVSGTVAA